MKSPQTNAPDAGPASSRTLLIVDPSKNRFASLVKLLSESNFKVEFLSDKEADPVARIVDIKPDMILMNLFLNNKSTLPYIKDVKNQLKRYNTKIIVLTAHQSLNNIKESVKAGADDFVLEPFDPRLMLQRIRYQLQDRESFVPDELKADGAQIESGFQLIYDSLRLLSEMKDHHEALVLVLQKVAELAGSNRVNLIEGDLETNEGIVAATSDDPNLKDLKIDLEKYPEVREVLLNSNIVYIKDITANPLTQGIREQVKSIQITSLLVFPIRHRNNTLGAVSVRLAGGKEDLKVSEKHLKTFYMIALAVGSKIAARKLLRSRGQKPAAAARPGPSELPMGDDGDSGSSL
jgi:DNA-binding response OmpR family regulator